MKKKVVKTKGCFQIQINEQYKQRKCLNKFWDKRQYVITLVCFMLLKKKHLLSFDSLHISKQSDGSTNNTYIPHKLTMKNS